MPYASSTPPRARAAEALAEFPPAWIGRDRAVLAGVARSGCRRGAHRQLGRTAAERALVWLRRNALRSEHAASRGVPPDALAEFPPAWSERVREGEFCLA